MILIYRRAPDGGKNKISLTTMILLALVLGMIIGVVLNNTASPKLAKLYAQEISIFTTIFLRLIK
ncbi:hypothetical protein ACLB1R_15390 [Escherichia coli]